MDSSSLGQHIAGIGNARTTSYRASRSGQISYHRTWQQPTEKRNVEKLTTRYESIVGILLLQSVKIYKHLNGGSGPPAFEIGHKTTFCDETAHRHIQVRPIGF